jgi:hypothetical protein
VKPKYKNEDVSILWNVVLCFEIEIFSNKPDVTTINNKEKKIWLIEILCIRRKCDKEGT